MEFLLTRILPSTSYGLSLYIVLKATTEPINIIIAYLSINSTTSTNS